MMIVMVVVVVIDRAGVGVRAVTSIKTRTRHSQQHATKLLAVF